MTYITESTPTERAAIVTYWLVSGRELSTADVAENLQVSQRTARRLFTAVSRAVPIYRDEAGLWRILEDDLPLTISPY